MSLSLSPFTALGPDLFRLLLSHICANPLNNPLSTHAFRALLPFALVCRTHYLWTLSSIQHLSILPPDHHNSTSPPHPLRTPRPTFSISASHLTKALPTFPSLRSLHLSLAAKIDDNSLQCILSAHPTLRKLRLPACRNLSAVGVAAIATHCPQLVLLDISFCPSLDDAIAPSIALLSRLQTLHVAYLAISDKFLLQMTQLPLQVLCLTACTRVTAHGVAALRRVSTLHTLIFRCAPGVNDECVASLQNCAVQNVDLGLSRNVTDAGVAALVRIHALEGVGLSQCMGVSDVGVRDLGCLRALKWFDVSFCRGVGDWGLEGLRGLEELEEVNVGGCEDVTDEGVRVLVSLRSLRRLGLAYCRGVTGMGVEWICNARNAPLRLVDVRECRGISDGGVRRLRERCIEVKVKE